MKNTKYNKICDKYIVKENKIMNSILSFTMGGVLGVISEMLIQVLCFYFNISRSLSVTITIIIFIFISSLLTGLGVFDKLVSIFKTGLLIPITGFSHSMTSSSLDYKCEGFIYGIGSNFFKLSGSVILYGVISAFIVSFIRYFFEVIL